MKTNRVIGSILAIFLLMMLPSVPAVEFTTAVESNKPQILEQIQGINVDEFKEKLKNLDFHELKEKLKNIADSGSILQAFMYLLSILIYSLLNELPLLGYVLIFFIVPWLHFASGWL